MQSKPLSRKLALVTGSSRGLGRKIALRLANDGARIAIHYCSKKKDAEDVMSEIKNAGGEAFTIGADFSSVSGIEFAVSELITRAGDNDNGRLDILVNNAGAARAGNLEGVEEVSFDHRHAIYAKAPFFLVKFLLPFLNDGGRVINISSTSAVSGRPDMVDYAMAKAALNSFTLSLAQQLGPRNITVNAVCPGRIDNALRTPAWREASAAKSVFNRVCSEADIADIVGFIASDDSRWLTGCIFAADGGERLKAST